jgi:hypothetical protein
VGKPRISGRGSFNLNLSGNSRDTAQGPVPNALGFNVFGKFKRGCHTKQNIWSTGRRSRFGLREAWAGTGGGTPT